MGTNLLGCLAWLCKMCLVWRGLVGGEREPDWAEEAQASKSLIPKENANALEIREPDPGTKTSTWVLVILLGIGQPLGN